MTVIYLYVYERYLLRLVIEVYPDVRLVRTSGLDQLLILHGTGLQVIHRQVTQKQIAHVRNHEITDWLGDHHHVVLVVPHVWHVLKQTRFKHMINLSIFNVIIWK